MQLDELHSHQFLTGRYLMLSGPIASGTRMTISTIRTPLGWVRTGNTRHPEAAAAIDNKNGNVDVGDAAERQSQRCRRVRRSKARTAIC